jgi:transcriptional regulator with XRE-family HTH domain
MEPGFDRIRELRLEQGMSQRELARRAKVKRSTVRRIEKGTCRTSTDVYQRLLNPLGYEIAVRPTEIGGAGPHTGTGGE